MIIPLDFEECIKGICSSIRREICVIYMVLACFIVPGVSRRCFVYLAQSRGEYCTPILPFVAIYYLNMIKRFLQRLKIVVSMSIINEKKGIQFNISMSSFTSFDCSCQKVSRMDLCRHLNSISGSSVLGEFSVVKGSTL